MVSWLKRFAAPIAAVALFSLASVAQATPVQFYTVGYFSGPGTFNSGVVGPDFKQQSSVTVDGDSDGNAVKLAYENSSTFYNSLVTWPVTTGPLTVNFGQFILSGTGGSVDVEDFAGRTFTLEFHQLQPTMGSSSLVESVTGTVTYIPPSMTLSGALQIQFDPNFTFIPDAATGVKYTVAPTTGGLVEIAGGVNPNGTVSTLQGTIAVPLPGVAWAGIALLGGVGGLRKFRRKRAEEPVVA